MVHTNYSSDSPVNTIEQDRFKRWEFSKRIAEVISMRNDPASIVIGLYGSWGNGKTSVLNFIEQSLLANDDVIYLKFNPWRFTSEEDLLRGFFNDIIEALDKKLYNNSDKLKEAISKTAPGFAALLGAKGAGDAVSSFISGPDLVELKQRVEDALEEEKKRVLITIDDIDRLDKSEIHSLFKLVKLSADFKYTSYILAFDKDVVTASLQDRYSNSNAHAGEAFLEKIIQVPLHLPSIEKSILQDYCFQSLNQALDFAQISLSRIENQYFIQGFNSVFDDLITTPRKAKLYGNTLLFALPILKGEVNHVELMLLEGLRVFCPTVYEMLKINYSIFTGVMVTGQYSDNEKDIEHIKRLINESIAADSTLNEEKIISLLSQLFPKLDGVYGNTFHHSSFCKDWDLGKRVCSNNYAPRYFSYAIQDNDIRDEVISEFLSKCENNIFDIEQPTPLELILTEANAPQTLGKIFSKFSTIKTKGKENLAKMIANIGHTLATSKDFFDWNCPKRKAALLIADLIQTSPKEERLKLALDCLLLAKSFEFKIEIERNIWKEDPSKPEKEGFNANEIQKVNSELDEWICEDVNGKDITATHQDFIYRVVSGIKNKKGSNYVSDLFQSTFQANKESVVRLLEAYVPTKWDMSNGLPSKDDMEISQFQTIINHINVRVIVEAIEANYSDSTKVYEKFPDQWTQKSTDSELYLQQFMWFTRNSPNTE